MAEPGLDLNLVLPLIDAALAEDVGRGDVTTLATVPASAKARAEIAAKADGVVCGLTVARAVFQRVEPRLQVELDAADGDAVLPGQTVLRVDGPARGILSAERVALNFLQHLSGIATATRQAVRALEGTSARILDTRKTLPGMRLLAKYAVRTGGGGNHRHGLYDMVLIKDNHIAAAGGIAAAMKRARDACPGLAVEVEVADFGQLEEALAAAPDRVMLDNFSPEAVQEAVARIAAWAASAVRERPEVEVSGGITAESLRAYAAAGVDFISSGALTHSARALDLSLTLRLDARGGKA